MHSAAISRRTLERSEAIGASENVRAQIELVEVQPINAESVRMRTLEEEPSKLFRCDRSSASTEESGAKRQGGTRSRNFRRSLNHSPARRGTRCGTLTER